MSSDNAPIAIRRLGLADLADYKRLRDAMLEAHPEAFTSDAAAERPRPAESYRSRLGLDHPERDDFTLGAWRGGELIGAISLERDLRLKVRHIGHLVGMMVGGSARGLGIGRGLLTACIAQACSVHGLKMLTLSVTAGNGPAIALYERAGFVRYGSLPRAICVEGCFHAKDLMALTL
jgi:RimJ/RimL family protein N-acetyltransferase